MFQSMSTIREKADETAESPDGKDEYEEKWQINKDITKETDSGDDEAASYSSTTSLDSLADSRARLQKARNITEKRRRDKLNMYINQLAASLPQQGHQRLDKSTILKQGVDYLRKCNDLKARKAANSGIPISSFLSAEELGELMLESINGVILCINEECIITFVAEHFKHVFGLEARHYVGQSIEKFVHADDLQAFREKIRRSNTEGAETQVDEPDKSGCPGSVEDSKACGVDVSFRLASSDVEHESYRKIRCIGKWKEKTITENNGEKKQNLLVLMAMPTNQYHLRELCYPKAPNSFTSRHGMDGKFLFVDSSCTLVTGYLPYELMNTSLYFLIHEADLEEVIRAHRSLTTPVDVGSVLVFFRFRSKSNQWLLMKVILRVTYNPMTSKPEYFNANLTLATRDEIYQYKKMRFSNAEKCRDESVTYENMLSGSSSLLLASLTRERQMREKNRVAMSVSTGQAEQAEYLQNDANNSSFVRQRSNSREQQIQITGTSFPTQSVARRKGKSIEALKESEATLHEQLNEKIGRLTLSIKNQESRLEKINKMMAVIRPKMMFSEGLKKQQQQEQQIYDCLRTTVAEQQKQCHKLKNVLEGKMKIFETKRRAIELRGKTKAQKQTLGERAESQSAVSSPSPGSSRDTVSGMMLPSPQSQGFPRNDSGPMLSPTCPYDKSPLHRELNGESGTSTDTMRCDMPVTYQNNMEQSSQQSLQRQLQHLQHQQDVLNAQGMALAAQGGMSGAQLQVFQSLMQQHKAMMPFGSSSSSSESQLRTASDSGLEEDFPMQGRTMSDSGSSFRQSPSELQLQISRLQNFQQELQLQMQMLQNQQSENGGNQANGVNDIMLQLQQRQHAQMDLLRGREQLSPRQQSADSNYMQQGNLTNDPAPTTTYRMTSSTKTPLSSIDYTQDTSERSKRAGRQEPCMDGGTGMFQHSQRLNMFPSCQMSASESRSNLSMNNRQRLPPDNSVSFQQMNSTHNPVASSPAPLSSPYANSQERSRYNQRPFNDTNGQGSSQNREKEKKLEEEDNIYQYINNLPGQTQQLMQLHQAQRMHILRQQQQQLQALQRNQQQQQQQHQQQLEQQQQHNFQHQSQLQLNTELNHSQAELVSPSIRFDQGPSGIIQNTADADIDDLATLNQWQNDLQVGQVSAMSDMDLFELLSGQSAMNLTEQDEQVLDLLIAEGDDMLPM